MDELKELSENHINQIFALQEEVFDEGYNEDLLRHNSVENFKEIFKRNHKVVGYFYKDKIVAFGMLYASNKNEILTSTELIELALSLEKKELKVAVVKLIIVKKEFRGNGFQRKILAYFEKYAKQNKINLLIASVSPLNIYSINNFCAMGYSNYLAKKLYGRHDRFVFFKFI